MAGFVADVRYADVMMATRLGTKRAKSTRAD